MRTPSFEQQLLDASPGERRALIERRPSSVGEAEVHALAERARAAAIANPVESLRVAEIAVELAEALGEARARALSRRARAVALRANSRWASAIEDFNEGARQAEEAGDLLLAAQIPIAATDALAQLGRYDEALTLAESLEERLSALGAEDDAAKVVGNAGCIHFERDAYLEALDCYERSLAYFEARQQSIPAARLRMNLANILTHLNRLPEALKVYESARSLFDSAGIDVLVGSTDLNVAFLQFMAAQYAEALQAYQRARTRFEELGLTRELAVCDRETADVHLELNLIPEAQEAYERVLPVFGSLEMSAQVARSEMGLATTLAAQGREDDAMRALERAEQAFHRERNEIGVARARLQRSECRIRRELRPGELLDHQSPAFRDARREAVAALRGFRRQGLQMGTVQARLRLAEMRVAAGGSPVRTLQQLVREAEAGSFVSLIWRIEAALARACMNAGRERAALLHYRRAVEAVERVRLLLQGDDFRISFLQDKMRLYEELIALLLERGTRTALLESFEVAERSKSRTLLELLAGPVEEGAEDDPQRQALLQRLEELRAQLNWDYGRLQHIDGDATRLPVPDAALPERVRRLEREYLQTQRQLQIGVRGCAAVRGAGDPAWAAGGSPEAAVPGALLRAQDLQALLGDDEQIVEYVTVRDEVLAFVVDRRRFRTVQGLASRPEVEELVERLRFQWSKFRPRGYADRYVEQLSVATHQVLGELYELLLEPLEGLLPADRVTIIPHGLLHGIPFHALHDGEQYALDRWEFAYAPSAAVWRACRLRGEPQANGSLLIGLSEPDIAHVRDEVAALPEFLPDSTVYQDEAATLATVPTRGAYRYVHFATHAIFRQDNPLFSGLRMADGWLVANDLYRRRLDCSLATLSACRTGVSLVAPGDEVLGLPRAFLHAGARAVMVSLWTAHDAATAELMRACYARLTQGEGRAASLRAAQQEVRAHYAHPYYWGAFALMGAR